MRAQRSGSYLPGDRPERFKNALASGADAVVFDLEHSVAEASRESALSNVDAFLGWAGVMGATSVWVRVNDARVRHPAVVALAKHRSLDGFVVPKSETPVQCAGWDRPVLALIETSQGVVGVARIAAAASAHLHGIALGAEDLATALGVAPCMESMGCAASVVVMAAQAAGAKAYVCPGSSGEFRNLAACRATLDAGGRIGASAVMGIFASIHCR